MSADKTVRTFLTNLRNEYLRLGGLILPKTSGVGIKIDVDAAEFGWRELVGKVDPRSAGTGPAFSAYSGTIYQYEMGTASKEFFQEFMIPHDYVPATHLYMDARWSTIVAATGNVNWLFDVLYAKGHNQEIFEGFPAGTGAVTVSVTQAGGAAFKHLVAEAQISATGGLINPSGTALVSITTGTPDLTSDTAIFSEADIGRTVRVIAAGAAGAVLDTTISAFVSTTAVTLAANASTTVTTQNNFRYRVIDSALLEPDGILLVRAWRDAARAADTLDQSLFVHGTGISYQSTNIATKNRSYPFYT